MYKENQTKSIFLFRLHRMLVEHIYRVHKFTIDLRSWPANQRSPRCARIFETLETNIMAPFGINHPPPHIFHEQPKEYIFSISHPKVWAIISEMMYASANFADTEHTYFMLTNRRCVRRNDEIHFCETALTWKMKSILFRNEMNKKCSRLHFQSYALAFPPTQEKASMGAM